VSASFGIGETAIEGDHGITPVLSVDSARRHDLQSVLAYA